MHSFILALSETNYLFPPISSDPSFDQKMSKSSAWATPPPGLHEIRPNLSFHAVVVIVFSPTDSFLITFGL